MPGLVGLITGMPRERAERELLRMVESMRHEPSYASGTWSEPSLGLYVGWVARAGPLAGSMPFYNEQRDRVLIFPARTFPRLASLLAIEKLYTWSAARKRIRIFRKA